MTCVYVLPQVFVGKIPRDLYEDELVPLFEKAGPIWDLRLMMDPLTGQNRGYAFITFCSKEAAQEAVKLVRVFHFALCDHVIKSRNIYRVQTDSEPLHCNQQEYNIINDANMKQILL